MNWNLSEKRQVSAQQRGAMVTRCKLKINGSLQKLSTDERCPPISVRKEQVLLNMHTGFRKRLTCRIFCKIAGSAMYPIILLSTCRVNSLYSAKIKNDLFNVFVQHHQTCIL